MAKSGDEDARDERFVDDGDDDVRESA
jgi:hypothetical protein